MSLYIPYGEEWKKEMMKLKKETIIDMYKKFMYKMFK